MDAVILRSRQPAIEPREFAAIDDRLLVKRAGRGDPEAFSALYRSHVGRVFAVCRRLCGDPALAEDLCQETFVRAWSGLSKFRGDSVFATWLHRIAVNVFLGHQRRPGNREDHAAPAETGTDSASRVTIHPAAVSAVDLEREIARLPEGARTVLVLHDVEGYRHREIADFMGIAVGTSKAHLHRARRLLREALR